VTTVGALTDGCVDVIGLSIKLFALLLSIFRHVIGWVVSLNHGETSIHWRPHREWN